VFSIGSLIPESSALDFESTAAGRVAYLARHEGVRAARRDPRRLRMGRARSAAVRSCRRAPSGPCSTRITLAAAPRSSW
jgi:hypothetical protein